MARQTIRYARQRAAWQTARNTRFGFPQRGRHVWVTDSTHQGVICLPLSIGHREWKW